MSSFGIKHYQKLPGIDEQPYHGLKKAKIVAGGTKSDGKPVKNGVLNQLSGEKAIALGLEKAGVEFVAAVPAFPGVELMENLKELISFRRENIGWYSNGKSAAEAAIGATIAGKRTALCCRGQDFYSTLELLNALPLAPSWGGGLLIVCTDDIGSWYNPSEPDSRSIAANVSLPVFEPVSILDAVTLPSQLMSWSILYSLPVVIRITTSFALESLEIEKIDSVDSTISFPPDPVKTRMVLKPAEVAERRVSVDLKFKHLQTEVEKWPQNKIMGDGEIGIVACGYVGQKILDLFDPLQYKVKLLLLTAIHPLPTKLISEFLAGVASVYILEEGTPYVETELRLLAEDVHYKGDFFGKRNRTFPVFGEFFRWSLEEFLERSIPDFRSQAVFFPFQEQKGAILHESLFPGEHYDALFELIQEITRELFPDKRQIWVGNPGSFLPRLLKQDIEVLVSLTPASSIGIAASISRIYRRKLVIAVMGDHAFYQSGLNSLIDAAYHKSDFVVLILDNQTATATGFQQTPGSGRNIKNRKTTSVKIENLLHDLPLVYQTCSLQDKDQLKTIIREVLGGKGLRILHFKISL